MMRNYLLSFLMLLCAGVGFGQSVLGAAGAYNETSSGSISTTLGETIIATHEVEDGIVTQGFHQTTLIISLVEDIKANDIKIFPNPTRSVLNVQAPVSGLSLARIIDASGRLIKSIPLSEGDESIDLSAMANGSYHLILIDQNEHVVKRAQVVKTN